MRRLATLALGLWAASAAAESAWLTGHGRLLPTEDPLLEAFVGTRSVGVGFGARGFGAELAYFYGDRFTELRGVKAWQLREGVASVSGTVGASAFVVPDAFDFGAGPHLGLTLGLGGERVQVDLGLQSGVDLFVRGWVRFPQRGLVGVRVRVWQLSIALQAKLGVDLEVGGRQAPWKGEAVLALTYDGPRAWLAPAERSTNIESP